MSAMAETEPNVCTICHRQESPERSGEFFDAISRSGMRLVHFWVCAECAIRLGPDQGGVASDLRSQEA